MLKFISYFLLLCLLTAFCKAQTGPPTKSNASFELIIKNSPEQNLIIRCDDGNGKKSLLDTVKLGMGNRVDSAHYELFIAGKEVKITLSFTKKRVLFMPIIAPGDHLKIAVDLNKPEEIKYTGSASTSEFYEFYRTNLTLVQLYNRQKNIYNESAKNGYIDSINQKSKLDSINMQHGSFLKKALLNTHNDQVAIFALMGGQDDVAYTAQEFNKLKVNFADAPNVLAQIKINENLQIHPFSNKPKPANGTYLANFALPDKHGKKISLDNFKGKYILVDFWASWCGPCRKQSPYLKQALQKYGQNNFMIVSVSIDENHNAWQKAIIQDGTQGFVNLIDDRGRKSPVTNQYNIELIPSNFLIDPTGKILDRDLRNDKIVSRIMDVINPTIIQNR